MLLDTGKLMFLRTIVYFIAYRC
uniref:Uncharacterized protein n=1 Tax=Rhizophora mucronata TaxID=61149 RepID=A0A2P2IZX9_RHIMU